MGEDSERNEATQSEKEAAQAAQGSAAAGAKSAERSSKRFVDFVHEGDLAAIHGVYDEAQNPLVSAEEALATLQLQEQFKVLEATAHHAKQ